MGKGPGAIVGRSRGLFLAAFIFAACNAELSAQSSSPLPSSPNVVATTGIVLPASPSSIATAPTVMALLDGASAVVTRDRFIKATRVTNGVQEATDNAGKLVVDPIDLSATLSYAVPDRLSSHITGGSGIIRIGTTWWTSGPDGRWQTRQGPAVSVDLNALLNFNRSQYSSGSVQGPISCGTSTCWSLAADWTTTLRPSSRISSILTIDLKTMRIVSEAQTETYEDGQHVTRNVTFFDHAVLNNIVPPRLRPRTAQAHSWRNELQFLLVVAALVACAPTTTNDTERTSSAPIVAVSTALVSSSPPTSAAPARFELRVSTSADVDRYFIGVAPRDVERLVGESIRAGFTQVPLPFDPHGLTFAIRELGGETRAGPWFATAFDLPNGTKLISIVPGIPCLFSELGPGGSRAKGFRFGADSNCKRPFAELETPGTEAALIQDRQGGPTGLPVGTPIVATSAAAPSGLPGSSSVFIQVLDCRETSNAQHLRPLLPADLLRVDGKIAYPVGPLTAPTALFPIPPC